VAHFPVNKFSLYCYSLGIHIRQAMFEVRSFIDALKVLKHYLQL